MESTRAVFTITESALRLNGSAEIVGVVGNIKVFDAELGDRTNIDSAVANESPIAYRSMRQGRPAPFGVLFARTQVEPSALAASLVKEIRAVDPDQPTLTVTTMEALYSAGVWRPRLATRLMTGLALIAFILTAGGIYGGVAYNVSRRTKEIGLRMALGATRGVVVAEHLRNVFGVTAIGIAAGLATATAASGALSSQLYGFPTTDLAVSTAACAVVLVVTILAAAIATSRAASVDPTVALRHD